MADWREWRTDRDFNVRVRHPALILVAEVSPDRFVVYMPEIATPWSKLLAAAAATLTCRTTELTLKLIGPAQLQKKAEADIRALGLQCHRSIVREQDYELRFAKSVGRLQVSRDDVLQASSSATNDTPTLQIGPLKVLVVDDSSSICKLLGRIVASDPALTLAAAITDPHKAEDLVRQLQPDVVTLDIHMPGIDGVTLLKRLRTWTQVPVIMISSITREEGPLVFEALDAGAFDYIQKPKFEALAQASEAIITRIKAAVQAQRNKSKHKTSVRTKAVAKAQYKHQQADVHGIPVVTIGSSTGGTEALKRLFMAMPHHIPPIVVVQHIPAVFSDALAKRFNQLCPFEVKEAQDGDEVLPDRVLIAPGGQQMRLQKSSAGKLRVSVEAARSEYLHNPSVDFLFDSAAEILGARAIGVILTGMGSDGAKGMLRMRQAGAHNIAQDEQSSVIFGMPREAIAAGAAHRVLPLDEIAEAICAAANGRRAAS